MSRNRSFGPTFATVSTSRSLILLSVGAIVGLLLSGYALFTARGTSTLFVPPEDVALVNQQPISRVDFLAQLQALYGVDFSLSTPDQRKRVMDDMIREELFVQRGKELDVAAYDPEVRSAIVNAVELEIAADAITSQPDDAKLRDFYQSHKASYESEGIVTFYDYVCDKQSPDSATAAERILRQEAPTPQSLTAQNCKSLRSPAKEEYYFAAKIHLGDRLFDAVRGLSDGEVSAPIEMADGVHLLYMVRNVKPALQDFAAVRDHVLTDFRKAAIERLRVGDEAYLRKRANILIADDMQ